MVSGCLGVWVTGCSVGGLVKIVVEPRGRDHGIDPRVRICLGTPLTDKGVLCGDIYSYAGSHVSSYL